VPEALGSDGLERGRGRRRVVHLERDAERRSRRRADLELVDVTRVLRLEQLERRASGLEHDDASVLAPILALRHPEHVAVQAQCGVEVVDRQREAELVDHAAANVARGRLIPRQSPSMARSALLRVAAGAAAVLAVPGAADAALALRFDRARARAGDSVVASQPAYGASRPAGVVVFLVPTRLRGVRPDPAGSYVLRRPPPHGAVELGPLRLVGRRAFAIRFRVPRVAPGDYTTAFWCHPCAPGGDFFASALWGAPWTGRPGGVLRVVR
jgi:hypothetical protein